MLLCDNEPMRGLGGIAVCAMTTYARVVVSPCGHCRYQVETSCFVFVCLRIVYMKLYMKLRRACMSSQIVIQKVSDEIIYSVDICTSVQLYKSSEKQRTPTLRRDIPF
jgi:hypothetical protein